MAMSGATLAAAIKSDLLNDPNITDNASLDYLVEAIANSVVAHITANAVVTVAAGIAVQVVPATGTGATTATGTGTIA